MSAIWLEKLRNAQTRAERDDILLREFRTLTSPLLSSSQIGRVREDVEDQIRALADLAIPK